MNKKGFTLSELMVVVLIIGILASVAIPEYMHAVDKSRWGSLILPERAIKEAQEAKYMQTGKYATTMQSLSVALEGERQENIMKVDKRTFTLDGSAEDGVANNIVVAEDVNLPNVRAVMYQTFSPNFSDDLHCEALIDDTRSNRLCRDVLDGQLIGKRAQYNSYLIEGTGAGKLMNWPQKMESCAVSTNTTCYGTQNEDGSWTEHYTASNGTVVDNYYDADGHLYKKINLTPEGYTKNWTYDAEGNRTSFEYYDPDGKLSQKAEYWPGTDNMSDYEWYYADGQLWQHNDYGENGTISSLAYYWSNNEGKVQFYNNYDSNGLISDQTKYWPDGSVRGYYTETAGQENGEIAVEYNSNGTLRYSETYSSPGTIQTMYYYNSDGTYVAKPSKDGSTTASDSSAWTYGTYTVGTNGDVLRDDGVTVTGQGNFSTLCTAHPDQTQCK